LSELSLTILWTFLSSQRLNWEKLDKVKNDIRTKHLKYTNNNYKNDLPFKKALQIKNVKLRALYSDDIKILTKLSNFIPFKCKEYMKDDPL